MSERNDCRLFEMGLVAAKAEPASPEIDVKTLHAKIGELTLENDLLAGALGKVRLPSAKQ